MQRASEQRAKEQEAGKNSMIPMGSTVFTWKHLAVDSLTKTSNLLKVWKEEWPHNGKKNHNQTANTMDKQKADSRKMGKLG